MTPSIKLIIRRPKDPQIILRVQDYHFQRQIITLIKQILFLETQISRYNDFPTHKNHSLHYSYHLYGYFSSEELLQRNLFRSFKLDSSNKCCSSSLLACGYFYLLLNVLTLIFLYGHKTPNKESKK